MNTALLPTYINLKPQADHGNPTPVVMVETGSDAANILNSETFTGHFYHHIFKEAFHQVWKKLEACKLP